MAGGAHKLLEIKASGGKHRGVRGGQLPQDLE